MSVRCSCCKGEITGSTLINCVNCGAMICKSCASKNAMICPYCSSELFYTN